MRDGHPYPPLSVQELELLPGVREALETLRLEGFRLIVVTNQPDVATGVQRGEMVEAIHEHLRHLLPIDDIKVCYHIDRDECRCRKPKPGMLLDAAQAWLIDLQRSFMVGDRWSDIAAGKAAGCKAILIGDGYTEPRLTDPDATVDSLTEASMLILSWGRAGSETRGGVWHR